MPVGECLRHDRRSRDQDRRPVRPVAGAGRQGREDDDVDDDHGRQATRVHRPHPAVRPRDLPCPPAPDGTRRPALSRRPAMSPSAHASHAGPGSGIPGRREGGVRGTTAAPARVPSARGAGSSSSAVWALLVIGIGATVSAVGAQTNNDLSLPGTDSQRPRTCWRTGSPPAERRQPHRLRRRHRPLTDDDHRQAVTASVKAMREVPTSTASPTRPAARARPPACWRRTSRPPSRRCCSTSGPAT